MPSCAFCAAEYQPPVYRTTVCPSCGRELKTCRNCRHFSPGAAHDCRENVSEPVMEKDRANFCDWFGPADNAGAAAGGQSASSTAADEARKAFMSLFGDE